MANMIFIISLVLLASLVDMSPLLANKLVKSSGGNKLTHLNQKRTYFNPLFDDVNRCIMACGECAGDLDTPDDKVKILKDACF